MANKRSKSQMPGSSKKAKVKKPKNQKENSKATKVKLKKVNALSARPKPVTTKKSPTKNKTTKSAKSATKTTSKEPIPGWIAAKTRIGTNAKFLENSTLMPYRDGVLVERLAEPDRTPGGLYIPVTALEKPIKGRVIQSGKGKWSKKGRFQHLDVKSGDEVLFAKHAGTEVHINGNEYLLIREDEILGVVNE